ncbi:hypothetical protein GQ53DRAFT_743521 [Thozetella sp. PMI_491]|nr:hypothetical protein GQ53DRAFT_743521 [Thozetella sp. PMI_491]
MSSQTSELSAWKRAGLIQKKLARSRPAIAVVSALVEFQEVQGFFVAAIQFATLAVYTARDNAALLSSMSSFSEAVLNTDVVQTLSVNGVLPVLFIQISLLRCGVRWWYMLSIVVLVFVLAAIIMSLDLTPDFDTLWTYFKESAPIVRCGGNPSPMTYCLDALTDLDNVLKPLNTGIVIGCVAVPAFIIHQLWPSVSAWLDVDRWLDAGETRSQLLIVIRRRIWPVASVLLWAGLELWLLIYVGFYMKALLTIMSRVSKDSSEWGYGQLVAVMVWAPVLGKYIYFNICRSCLLSPTYQ